MTIIPALLNLLIALVILGVVLWLISLLPLDPTIRQLIRGVAIVIVVLLILFWVLGAAGFVTFPAVKWR